MPYLGQYQCSLHHFINISSSLIGVCPRNCKSTRAPPPCVALFFCRHASLSGDMAYATCLPRLKTGRVHLPRKVRAGAGGSGRGCLSASAVLILPILLPCLETIRDTPDSRPANLLVEISCSVVKPSFYLCSIC